MSGDNDTFAFGSGFPAADDAGWRELVEKVLRGAPFERLVAQTADGIAMQPLHVTPAGGLKDIVRPVRSDAGAWTVLARIDHRRAGDGNRQALDDIANGAGGLHIVLAGGSGALGLGLQARESLAGILAGVDPAHVALELDLPSDSAQTANEAAQFVTASGLNPASARISFGLDPFAALLSGAEDKEKFANHANAATALAKTLSEQGFAGPFLCADARPVHAAGGSEAQELAFLLGAATEYLRVYDAAGMPLQQAQNFTGLRIAADADQFLTIAKLRALRRLMARVVEACGLGPAPVNIHAETAFRMMTRIDPWVNVLRSTVAAFAAITGGADRLTVLPHTQALGLPDAEARRLARNLQVVLQEESHLGIVDDPAGGAGGIEDLTNALCDKAWSLFQEHERLGGLANVIASGAFGQAVTAVREHRMQSAASGATPITGTSTYPDLHEQPASVEQPINDNWRDTITPALRPWRLSEPFEALRSAADTIAANGKRPEVFLVNIGPLAAHNARANFATNFFAAGGIAARGNDGFATPEQAGEAFSALPLPVACLCSSDDIYAEQAAAIITLLKQAAPVHVLLAGRPGANRQALEAAGLDGYIYQGCNMIDTLGAVLKFHE